MRELFETWWYGGLVVPIVLAVFLGGFVAIWTGVFVARLVAFDQARMAAVNILWGFVVLPDCDSPEALERANRNMVRQLMLVATEFMRLRQRYACGMMVYFADQVGQSPWGDPPRGARYPLNEGEKQTFLDRLQPFGRTFGKMAFDLRPEICPLVTVRRQVRSSEPLGNLATEKYASVAREVLERYEKSKAKKAQGA
jgi:hypothetical protein